MDADELSDVRGLPCWLLTSGTDGVVRCWDFDRPHASYTVVGLAPGETRHVYVSRTCVRQPAVADAGGRTGLAAMAAEAEAAAAGPEGRHFPAFTAPDGIRLV
jgi:hypothetical protein